MASLKAIATDDETGSQTGSAEPQGPVSIACDILQLMNTSPRSLLNIANNSGDDAALGGVFGSFLLCIASPCTEIRVRASNVAKQLFAPPRALDGLHIREKHITLTLKHEFWNRRCALAATTRAVQSCQTC